MTLYLHNTSKKKTVCLRYGNGNNCMLQLNPEEKKELPREITKQKLQSYLHLFKDLKVEEEVVKVDEDKSNTEFENNDTNNTPSESTGSGNTEGELNDSSEDNADTQGESDENVHGGNNSSEDGLDEQESSSDGNDLESDKESTENTEKDNEKNNSSEGELDGQESQDKKESSSDGNDSKSNKESTGDAEKDNGETITFTEKELTALKADQIKELAKTLGIEVTEDSTKKGLIPVILDKQGKLE